MTATAQLRCVCTRFLVAVRAAGARTDVYPPACKDCRARCHFRLDRLNGGALRIKRFALDRHGRVLPVSTSVAAANSGDSLGADEPGADQ